MKKPIKLPQEIVKLLLPRLKDEFDAAYLYRAMSNWCQGIGYFVAAEFFDWCPFSFCPLGHDQV